MIRLDLTFEDDCVIKCPKCEAKMSKTRSRRRNKYAGVEQVQIE